MAHGVEIFVIFVSLALGLQNGAFRRAGGINVHTTYLTGMITSLISMETEKYASEAVPPAVRAPDTKIGLLCGIWIAFVLGAGTGAAVVLHFKALGMLGAALLLIPLIRRGIISIGPLRMAGNSYLESHLVHVNYRRNNSRAGTTDSFLMGPGDYGDYLEIITDSKSKLDSLRKLSNFSICFAFELAQEQR
jgi:hypothetical protein